MGFVEGIAEFISESIMVYVMIGVVFIPVIYPLLVSVYTNTTNAATSILLFGLIAFMFAVGLFVRAVRTSLGTNQDRPAQ